MKKKESLDDILDDLKDLLYILETLPAESYPINYCVATLAKYDISNAIFGFSIYKMQKSLTKNG